MNPRLILKCLYTFPAFKSLLKCVAHSKSQELNDELSVWSQVSTWLRLVCIKSQQGGKMATPPKQVLCKRSSPNPSTQHPLHVPTVLCSWQLSIMTPPAPLRSTAQFTSLPLTFKCFYGLKQIVIILSSPVLDWVCQSVDQREPNNTQICDRQNTAFRFLFLDQALWVSAVY